MKYKLIFILTGLLYVLAACSSDDDSESDSDPIMMEDDDVVIVQTDIPDVAFERALIELGIDDAEDGQVQTSNLNNVTDLVIESKGISDLSGIEDFTNLEGIWVKDNMLTSVDVSNNRKLKFLFIADNSITSVNVSNLGDLEKIEADNNSISQLDISDNTSLQLLTITNNQLQSIDVSIITDIIQLNTLAVENNPLDCIQVNEDQLNNIPSQWTKDTEDVYALDCN